MGSGILNDSMEATDGLLSCGIETKILHTG